MVNHFHHNVVEHGIAAKHDFKHARNTWMVNHFRPNVVEHGRKNWKNYVNYFQKFGNKPRLKQFQAKLL